MKWQAVRWDCGNYHVSLDYGRYWQAMYIDREGKKIVNLGTHETDDEAKRACEEHAKSLGIDQL